MTVYVEKAIGDKDHVKVFASEESAYCWFAEHSPDRVAFAYPVINRPSGWTTDPGRDDPKSYCSGIFATLNRLPRHEE